MIIVREGMVIIPRPLSAIRVAGGDTRLIQVVAALDLFGGIRLETGRFDQFARG
jgi:hypothetical protein